LYQKTVLDNGLRIVTETIPHVRSVTIGFWFHTGSRDETLENNGISHFIEHVMFKGTKTRTARQIAETMDATGGQMNAFTGKESTCYYARVQDKHLSTAVELLADMFLNSTFRQEELAKEKSVILEEIKMYEDSPEELAHDLFVGAVLKNHPLSLPIMGTGANIARMGLEDIREYMGIQYVPGNLVVAAAGNIEHDQVVAEMEKHFGHLQGAKPPKRVFEGATPERLVFRRKDTEQIHLCLGTKGVDRSHPDKFALYLLDVILGGGMSSRLFQELREERGLVYSAYSFHSCFQDTGIFGVYAGTGPDNVEEVLKVIYEQLELMGQSGPTAQELHRAKEQLKGGLLLSLESTTNRMSRIAKSELYYQEILTPDDLIARIDGVSTEDICRVAQGLLRPEEFSLVAIGPTDDALLERAG
jgi:predicted Zn-dependent peptidase